jgi:uncharacterized protein
MKIILCGIALATGLVAAMATGSPAATPAAPKDDPAKIALAHRILVETHADANTTEAIDVMLSQMVNALKQSQPEATEKVLERFRTLVRAIFVTNLPKLEDLQARIWARHFSESDLRELADFYKTPLGQRVTAETPKIMKEMSPAMFAWGQAISAQAMAQAIGELRKEGMKV